MINVQVGDKVGVARWNRSYGGYKNTSFGKVTKINGYGHIFVQSGDKETRFNKYGKEYKNETYGLELMDAVKLKDYINKENARKAVASVARQIETTMKEGWSYSGTWNKNDERIEKLKTLIAELEGM